jgi:hypothetical protein
MQEKPASETLAATEVGGKSMRTLSISLTVFLALAVTARAERPPQPKSAATDVIAGTVEKLTTSTSPFGGDGVSTTYTATVKVDEVEKGKNVKPGDTITVSWYKVTKSPSRPLPGAYGHGYPVKENGKIRAWLLKGKDKSFGVIYNHAGIETLKTDK